MGQWRSLKGSSPTSAASAILSNTDCATQNPKKLLCGQILYSRELFHGGVERKCPIGISLDLARPKDIMDHFSGHKKLPSSISL